MFFFSNSKHAPPQHSSRSLGTVFVNAMRSDLAITYSCCPSSRHVTLQAAAPRAAVRVRELQLHRLKAHASTREARPPPEAALAGVER